MRSLVVLGATGSVGRNTLDVAARHPGKLRVQALTAHRDAAGLFDLIVRHRPARAALVEPAAADELRRRVREAGLACEVLSGATSLEALAADGDIVMSAIVGAAGLLPTLSAIRAGRQVLIANKEPLVMAGRLMMGEAAASGATVIPIDSEHNAIFQCLPPASRCGTAPPGVRRLILTASGGPFRCTPRSELERVTAAQAVRHPNWTMGPKISVDSATLMNKGLELIEAAALYRLPPDQLDVVVHPESIIHSLVEYVDGSTLAQLGQPDMRVPIAHALAYPERWESGVGGLDLAQLGQLRFESPDLERFPSLKLARAALAEGEILPNALNAANEIAVEAFLKGALGFMGIPDLVERCCDAALGAQLAPPRDLEAVLEVDAWARRFCKARLN